MTASLQILGSFDFEAFDRSVRGAGWRRDPDAVPVDAHAPAFGSWSREPDGQMEYVDNPQLGVRALAVRGEDMEQYLRELNAIVRLAPSPLSLSDWEQGRLLDPRTRALVSAEVIKAQVLPLLAELRDDPTGEIARALQARNEDYALVFVQSVAEQAAAAYRALWADPASEWRPPPPDYTDILCYVSPAGMFATDNELSYPFPGGYRAIAHLLAPSRTWVAWKYVRRGETSGLAYNGLVWVDGHWAWFPKPYRVLAGL